MKADKANTPEEKLDLVDENDQIIGEVLKGEANKYPKFIHREITVFIYDDQNRLLFQQRSSKKKVRPGFWTAAVAGHVPKGMEPLEAAHMELKEELGFDTPLKFINKKMRVLPNETHFTYCYLGKYSGKQIKIETEEVEQVKFLSEKEFEQLFKEDNRWDELTIAVIKDYWQYQSREKS